MQETWILRKMAGQLLLIGSLGGLILAMVIAGSKRIKHENDDNSSMNSSQQSDDASVDVEVAAPKRRSKRALKKEDGKSSGDIGVTPSKDHYCRFCSMKFDKSQALGGHMNRHRKERENEEHQKAINLVSQREQHYGGVLWSMQGAGAGSLHQGGNLLPNSSLTMGEPSRPHFPPNQPGSTLQNWSQLLATQQTAYSLQSQQPGGSYHNPLENARPLQGLPSHPPQAHHASGLQHPAHHQHLVNPGQHPVQQMAAHMAQSGADNAVMQSHGSSSFQLNQAGPSPLEEVVLRSTNSQVQSNNPFIKCTSQSNMQFVDQYGNSRLPPLNETHFQTGQGQGHRFQEQHYISYDQEAGTSALGRTLGSYEVNQVPNEAHNQGPGSGILHMLSFQDGNAQSTAMVEIGQVSLEGDSPYISSDEKSQR